MRIVNFRCECDIYTCPFLTAPYPTQEYDQSTGPNVFVVMIDQK